VKPTAIQILESPTLYILPGSPISIQPDMSEAPADKAVTHGPILRPPSIYSLRFDVDYLYAYIPIAIRMIKYTAIIKYCSQPAVNVKADPVTVLRIIINPLPFAK